MVGILLFVGVYIIGFFDSKAIVCIHESGSNSNHYKVIHGTSRVEKFIPRKEKNSFNSEEIWTLDYKAEESNDGTFGDYEYVYFISVNPVSKTTKDDSGKHSPVVKVLRPMKVNFIYVILYFIVLIVFSVASIPLFKKDKWETERNE